MRNSKASTSKSSFSVSLELDVEALKLKNIELTKALANAKAKNACQEITLNELQKELYESTEKYNNLKVGLSKVDTYIKRLCLPKTIEYVNSLESLLALINVAGCVDPAASQTRDVVKMHAVKPQIVNGTVLLNPTLTLTRCDNVPQPEVEMPEPASEMVRSRRRDAAIGCASVASPVIIHRLNLDDNQSTQEEAESSNSRLQTIREEEEKSQSSPRKTNSAVFSGVFQDVKVYLNQLPNELIQSMSKDYEASTSFNNTTRSSVYEKFPIATNTLNTSAGRNGSNKCNSTSVLECSSISEYKPDCNSRNDTITPTLNQFSNAVSNKHCGGASCSSSIVTSTPIDTPRKRTSSNVRSEKFVTKKRRGGGSACDSTLQTCKKRLTDNCDSSDEVLKKIKTERQLEICIKRSPKKEVKVSTSPSACSSNSGSSPLVKRRPKRNVKQVSLKEPSLHKKLRRSK